MIKNPYQIRFFIDLVQREQKLYRILEASTKEIKYNLSKAEEIRREIYEKMKNYSYHGAMVSPLEGPIIYCIVRILKPEIVIETGVANGASSTFILNALEENNKGRLYSIDLLSKELQVKEKEIGWLIPKELRHRWNLHLGDSKELLPKFLQQLGYVDIFLHDSLHTLEHVLFELRIASAYIKSGILIADDVHPSWINKICNALNIEKHELFNDLLVLKK
ncbi:MAG TPA: class I SAM-dependent methyltransferase [Geobacterales bacterium]|nr:class I SAM-dependent methyltransferase [Geobacterales bacterium]